jgi:hypothetical protein
LLFLFVLYEGIMYQVIVDMLMVIYDGTSQSLISY